MRTPDQPRVTGVLAPYAAEFRVELSRLGYSPYTASEHMYLMAHLSRWLDGHDLCPAELGPSRIEQFLSDRRANGQTRWVTPRGLVRLLGYLRGAGVVPEPPALVPSGPADRLIAAFGLRDLMIVDTGDVVMVCPKGRDADIRTLVAKVQAAGFEEVL